MSTFLRAVSLCIVGAIVVLMQACSTNETPVNTASNSDNKSALESLRNHLDNKSGAGTADRIIVTTGKNASLQDEPTYIGQVCDNSAVYGTCPREGIFNSAQWNNYKVWAAAGSTVTVKVNRTGCGIDPAFYVFQGLTTQYGALVVSGDDDFIPSLACGCYWDPHQSFVAPSTGWYTITVGDYFGCGDDVSYELIVTGIICDTDGDGINDSDDAYPNSDMTPTVTIDGCDSGVDNHVFPNGATMMDLINDCAANSTNHGDFVSCVSALTNTWKADGLITGAQKGTIQSCGGNANLP